jgi:hypothetical protein
LSLAHYPRQVWWQPLYHYSGKYKVVFNELDAFTAPHFTATGAPPAAERTRILLMNHHADNIWNEGKFLPLLTNRRRC